MDKPSGIFWATQALEFSESWCSIYDFQMNRCAFNVYWSPELLKNIRELNIEVYEMKGYVD